MFVIYITTLIFNYKYNHDYRWLFQRCLFCFPFLRAIYRQIIGVANVQGQRLWLSMVYWRANEQAVCLIQAACSFARQRWQWICNHLSADSGIITPLLGRNLVQLVIVRPYYVCTARIQIVLKYCAFIDKGVAQPRRKKRIIHMRVCLQQVLLPPQHQSSGGASTPGVHSGHP